MERRVVIGIDLGKKVDRTCLCVTEQLGDRFITRDLSRLPLSLDYSEVAKRIGAAHHRAEALVASANMKDAHRLGRFLDHAPSMDPDPSLAAQASVWTVVDSGGVGTPVLDEVRARAGILEGHLIGVQITGGTGHNFRLSAADNTVSKQFLISQLKRLTGFEPPRLQLPRSKESKALAEELAAFEMGITDSANPMWGAAQGKHDDMIIALALSTLPGAFPHHEYGVVHYA